VSKQDATLDFSWVENRPLDGSHSDLGKIELPESPNHSRLLSGIRSVYNQVTGAVRTTAPGLQPNVPTEADDIYSAPNENGLPAALPGLRVLALGMQCLSLSDTLPTGVADSK
jgi:hypothetical protein